MVASRRRCKRQVGWHKCGRGRRPRRSSRAHLQAFDPRVLEVRVPGVTAREVPGATWSAARETARTWDTSRAYWENKTFYVVRAKEVRAIRICVYS